ncbi:MAG TPA: family 10 glycosylhydrolase [Ignavibacteriales bacterium]|nr:family 10 glycosylhydrolase [Ignavibacteriales bacterium]HOL82019.1 family 10 glycosylhydrolase [Ignavibacteriales bacterium]HOM66101.1 family 10 glycosylhydrolase [Ignavibacteriales bacterium]HPD67680.1 family 10 glycosylhydrolase [Ignavibacteriales bacterium]HPP34154.1 family 10 glycosylhydrolase [Ignavibacteriales bacterium]
MKSAIIFLVLSFTLFSKPYYGVWIRPAEKPEELIKQIQNIKKAGFDAIFLETFYHGYVITPNSVFPHRSYLNGIDLLEIAAKECKKQKLELHVWLETFYWRVDTSLAKGFPYSPLLNDSSIAARLKSGELTGKSEFAHDFVNPLHPKVRCLLNTYVQQIISRYKIDGIHFDYIRYHAGKEHSGYDSLTLFTFYNDTKIDAKSIKEDSDEWRVWCLWRENVVTSFLKEISDTIRKVNPKIKISAAVFGDYYKARYINSKLQDWGPGVSLNTSIS